ncbi:asparagine rich protein, putative [Babesia bigemina]|uniref:Asparagine rich protein, putative n=1 Tax=Babesia bigemina TaxID=5866 RepID=A0A061D4A7_BABBI|nr:asparagine rich protein, putative [Babesia bigemina]CDR94882.1 asparagine rich protein, putative [Babesia bigemina]|eukprot:XP_012767068.1 asparagine rich protein, putative [Babesia bigemina]
MWFQLLKNGNSDKERLQGCSRRFDSNELEVLHKLYKELASRSQTSGIDKETFLQYFDLPGLWGERLFRHFDTNDSGDVELAEFLSGVAACCRGTHTEKITVLFRMFDLNEDGRVQKSELLAMLSNFPVMTSNMTKCSQRQLSNQSTVIPSSLPSAPRSGGTTKRSVGVEKLNSYVSNISESKCIVPGFHEPMIVKRTEPGPTAWKDVASSLSRLSLQSRGSIEFQSSMDISARELPDSPRPNDALAKELLGKKKVNGTTQSRPESGRSQNSGLVDRLSSVVALRDGKPDVDPSYGSSTRESGQSSPSIHRGDGGAAPEQSDPCPAGEDDKLVNKTVSDLKSTGKDVCRGTTERDEADVSIQSQSIRMTDLQDTDESILAANAIIEQERLSCGDSTTLDILVEDILEECQFSANGSFDFPAFKAWLCKNSSVLSMFSEYLHEEVWGLRGNAFMTSRENHALARGDVNMSRYPSVQYEQTDNDLSGRTDPELPDRVVQRMVYQMFLTNGKQSRAFEDSMSSLGNVVSDELLQYVQHVSTGTPTAADVKPTTAGHNPADQKAGANRSSPPMAVSIGRQLLSCPKCKTPLFMCPVCFRRHDELTLHISNEVHVECKNCSKQGQITVFTCCWICNWDFTAAVTLALSELQKRATNVDRKEGLTSPVVKAASAPCTGILREKRRSLLRPTISVSCSSSTSDSQSEINSIDDPGEAHRSTAEWPQPVVKMPQKVGYMYKRGRHFYTWEKRYYMLIDNVLYYYVSEDSTTPRGCIFLEGCYLDSLADSDVSNMFGFCICHKGQKTTRRKLYAQTQEDFVQWVDALSAAMKQQSLMQMYTVCEQLGHGKFSVVYRAINNSSGEEFAVKIVDKTRISQQERELLRSEIAILRLLRHQHVIYLKDVSDMRDSLYIVMELVRGGELYDLITQRHRLSEAHTHKIICQLLQIVAYLHKCGIIHRDIKPENILLTDKSEAATIKLTDFGLSTLCGPNELLTQPCGTLAYVAPEVLTLQGYNQKADVWSVGVIMYLLLRGRLPFSIKQPLTLDLIGHYRVRFDGRQWDSVSTCAKDLISKMLQPNPAARISVFEALEHIWVSNFVAVNHDEVYTGVGEIETTKELMRSLRYATDTTLVIPYSDSCANNIDALEAEEAEGGLTTVHE